jgi:hypothetical protein
LLAGHWPAIQALAGSLHWIHTTSSYLPLASQ